jgi:hypothetical protein
MIGGAEGDRTPDLMTASHALSQLSYGPERGNLAVVNRCVRIASVYNTVKFTFSHYLKHYANVCPECANSRNRFKLIRRAVALTCRSQFVAWWVGRANTYQRQCNAGVAQTFAHYLGMHICGEQ